VLINTATRLCVAVTLLTFGAACERELPRGDEKRPAAGRVIVYATLGADLVGPVFDAFTAETGLAVSLVTSDFAALSRQARHPGSAPPADLFIAGNGADLRRALELGIFRPTRSASIDAIVAAELRDPDGLWFALATELRPVVYRRDLVSAAELAGITDYAALAAVHWRGRLCLSSSHVGGNTALLALLIDAVGVRDAELAVRGWQQNLAIAVAGDDGELLQSLESGQRSLGIASSSALALHRQQRTDSRLAMHEFATPGLVQVDVIGAGVTRHAGNPEHALALLEWLLSATPNGLIASRTARFPVQSHASIDLPLAVRPATAATAVDIAGLGFLLEDAERLAERARYP
jgi:iron(III) transport system substrate-binding protein